VQKPRYGQRDSQLMFKFVRSGKKKEKISDISFTHYLGLAKLRNLMGASILEICIAKHKQVPPGIAG
jgi:hypothetical protein